MSNMLAPHLILSALVVDVLLVCSRYLDGRDGVGTGDRASRDLLGVDAIRGVVHGQHSSGGRELIDAILVLHDVGKPASYKNPPSFDRMRSGTDSTSYNCTKAGVSRSRVNFRLR